MKSINFRKTAILENISRLKMLSKVFIVYELWLIIVGIANYIYKPYSEKYFLEYIPVYIIFALINLLFIIFFNRNFNIKDNKYIKKYEIMILMYISFVMILGSVISLMDQNYYGHLMVFMINILSCCGLCVMNIKQSLVSILVSSSILIVALPFFQHSKNILTMHYFNLVLFIPICIGVSRVVYSRYCTNYRNNQRLKKQTSINKIINSKLKRANELLEQISTIDELTQIPNRRGLKNYIDVTLKYYGNRSFEFSTIMMDIDNFKGFNDNYGHHEGDKVLISIARKINSVASDSSGFTARWGGEEFIYVAFNMDKKSTLKVAEIMRKAVVDLKILHEYSKTSSFVTISLGVFSMNINDKKDIKTCMEKADKALYIAKRSGRNCFRYYQ